MIKMQFTMDEDRYEHVLESLGVIARLTENKRLSLRNGHVDIDNDKKFQFLKRWWHGDEREVCLNQVKQIFSEAIHMSRAALQDIVYTNNPPSNLGGQEIAKYLEKERSVRKYGRLSEALEAASHGIETHKVTYKNDDRFCSLVDVLVGHVRDQLHDMDMTLKVTQTLPPSPPPPLIISDNSQPAVSNPASSQW
jgi:hypothetical protein